MFYSTVLHKSLQREKNMKIKAFSSLVSSNSYYYVDWMYNVHGAMEFFILPLYEVINSNWKNLELKKKQNMYESTIASHRIASHIHNAKPWINLYVGSVTVVQNFPKYALIAEYSYVCAWLNEVCFRIGTEIKPNDSNETSTFGYEGSLFCEYVRYFWCVFPSFFRIVFDMIETLRQ